LQSGAKEVKNEQLAGRLAYKPACS
jgi:hypothetical protein